MTKQTLKESNREEIRKWIKGALRFASIYSVTYGILTTTWMDIPTVTQQTVQALWMIKWILFGIFFEVMRGNLK